MKSSKWFLVIAASVVLLSLSAVSNLPADDSDAVIRAVTRDSNDGQYVITTIQLGEVRNRNWWVNRDVAASQLKSRATNALFAACRRQDAGNLQPSTVNYETYEEGHEQGKEWRYVLYAVNVRGECRKRKEKETESVLEKPDRDTGEVSMSEPKRKVTHAEQCDFWSGGCDQDKRVKKEIQPKEQCDFWSGGCEEDNKEAEVADQVDTEFWSGNTSVGSAKTRTQQSPSLARANASPRERTVKGKEVTNAAQAGKKYMMVSWATNAYNGCDKGFANIVTGQPVLVTTRYEGRADESDKSTFKMQVLGYFYDNHREQLSQVAGTTKYGWDSLVMADTAEEALSLAEKRGLFEDASFSCEGPVHRIDMSGFTFQVPDTTAWAGVGEARFNKLRAFLDQGN